MVPGLVKNLDASVAELVVLGREGIAVDADLADGRFRWKLPGGKAVNVNLAAVRSGGGSGERVQFILQFVRIIGERVEVFAFEDETVGVAGGIDADGRRVLIDDDLLLLDRDSERDVEQPALAGGEGDGLRRGRARSPWRWRGRCKFPARDCLR